MNGEVGACVEWVKGAWRVCMIGRGGGGGGDRKLNHID